jgi:cysteinyl-tRNA synthetase
MSLAHLGATFDLHGGGIDLCFPHHENEIAQSERATGVKGFAAHWFHSAHLMVEGEKMSEEQGQPLHARRTRRQGLLAHGGPLYADLPATTAARSTSR